MKTRCTVSSLLTSLSLLTATIVAVSSPATQLAGAQNPQLQQRLTEVKDAAAKNKQALAHYFRPGLRTGLCQKGIAAKTIIVLIRRRL
jgi:hypothetical protein